VSKHYQTPQVDGNQELQVALLTRDLLNEGAANLPAHISNRLENARKLALAAKLEKVLITQVQRLQTGATVQWVHLVLPRSWLWPLALS